LMDRVGVGYGVIWDSTSCTSASDGTWSPETYMYIALLQWYQNVKDCFRSVEVLSAQIVM
jgi:hypothetical protein